VLRVEDERERLLKIGSNFGAGMELWQFVAEPQALERE